MQRKLFSKKSAINEPYYLRVTLGKPEQKQIEQFLTDEDVLRHFPDATFETAEQLFQKLATQCDENQSLVIPRIEVVLNKDGKTSTTDELFLKEFELDNQYQNILKPLSEAMFNMMPFSANSFEDKVDYLKEIFEAWEKSTSLDEQHLPKLPDFELDDEAYIELNIPYYQSHTNQEIVQASEKSLEVATLEGTPLDVQEEVPQSVAAVEVTEEIISFPPKKLPPEINLEESPNPKSKMSVVEQAFVPYDFELLNPKVKGWGTWVIAALDEANQEIEQLNIESHLIQQKIFDKKMALFEVEQQNQLAQQLNERDHRADLKEKVIAKVKKKLLIQANAEYSRAYAEETQQLQEFLEDSLELIEREKQGKARTIQSELQELVLAQNESLQSYYEQFLVQQGQVAYHGKAPLQMTTSGLAVYNAQTDTRDDSRDEKPTDEKALKVEVLPTEKQSSEFEQGENSSQDIVQHSTQEHAQDDTQVFAEGYGDAAELNLEYDASGEEKVLKAEISKKKPTKFSTKLVTIATILLFCLVGFLGGWTIYQKMTTQNPSGNSQPATHTQISTSQSSQTNDSK
ncbi:MAG: hypothetical protein WAX22_02815 [Lactococcus hircilactis]